MVFALLASCHVSTVHGFVLVEDSFAFYLGLFVEQIAVFLRANAEETSFYHFSSLITDIFSSFLMFFTKTRNFPLVRPRSWAALL